MEGYEPDEGVNSTVVFGPEITFIQLNLFICVQVAFFLPGVLMMLFIILSRILWFSLILSVRVLSYSLISS